MALDYSTLALSLSIAMATRVAITTMQWAVNREYKGIGLWAVASVLSMVGFLVVFVRSGFPEQVWLAWVQNALIVGAVMFEYAGSVAFLGGRVPWRHIGGTFAVFAAALAYLTFVNDDIELRTALVHLLLATVTWATAVAFMRSRIPSIKAAAGFMAAVLTLAGAFFALRFLGAVIGPARESIVSPTAWQTLELIVALAEGMLLTFTLVLMVNQRLNSEVTAAKNHFELLYEVSPEASLITRLADGLVVKMNEGFTLLTGYTPDEYVGRSTRDTLWPTPERRDELMARFRQEGTLDNIEVDLLRKDGTPIIGMLSATQFDIDGVPHLLSVIRDITDRKATERDLEFRATTDPLTGVANRRHFWELAQRELVRAARTERPLSLVLLDVDHLKEINDAGGHGLGDKVLCDLAAACRGALREGDILGRLGGDEFIVALPDAGPEAACEIAERIKTAMSAGVGMRFTCSLGVATLREDETIDAVIARADAAMYEAKDRGRDQVVCT